MPASSTPMPRTSDMGFTRSLELALKLVPARGIDDGGVTIDIIVLSYFSFLATEAMA
jgi:hypothetical protein